MPLDPRTSRKPHVALIALGVGAGLMRVCFPRFDLIFRLAFSALPFAIVLSVLRAHLRTRWLWTRLLPVFAAHCVLVALFLPWVRQVNIWIWGLVIVAEGLLICIAMIPGLPADWEG